MMHSAQKLNKQGDNIQPCHTCFPILNQFVVPCLVLTAASWPAYRFLRRQVRWSGIPISWGIFQFTVIHIVKGLSTVNEAEADVFLEFLCFFYDPAYVGNLISGSSAFLNPAYTSGSSWFMYCWSFARRIFSITFLVCKMNAKLCSSLSILWRCLSLGLEWKPTFSSPVATAAFSKVAGILSAALSQHHHLGFEIAQLEFHHLH